MFKKRKGVHWLRFVLLLILLVIVWGIMLSIDIYTYLFATDSSSADAAIVLGAAAWGTQPSPVFEERIVISQAQKRASKIRPTTACSRPLGRRPIMGQTKEL